MNIHLQFVGNKVPKASFTVRLRSDDKVERHDSEVLYERMPVSDHELSL